MVVIGIPTYEPMCLQNLVIAPSRKTFVNILNLRHQEFIVLLSTKYKCNN